MSKYTIIPQLRQHEGNIRAPSVHGILVPKQETPYRFQCVTCGKKRPTHYLYAAAFDTKIGMCDNCFKNSHPCNDEVCEHIFVWHTKDARPN
jgi:hypothetical protein